MNKSVLLKAQDDFVKQYPGGFGHEDLQVLRKKFKMELHTTFAQERFAADQFDRPADIVRSMAELGSKSAMVSMFEKPKLKEAVNNLSSVGRRKWSDALYEILHGEQQEGFDQLVSEMAKQQLAKWTLVTLVPGYYAPNDEVFVKPSTTKMIVKQLELDLTYKPTPSWAFYSEYRKSLRQMRRLTKQVKAKSYPAFTGFLMMTLGNRL
jgi:hypothetical protein